MTTLPYFPDIKSAKDSTKAVQAETNWIHNWLYSVVPVSERIEDTTNKQYPSPFSNTIDVLHNEINYPLGAYLTGYCRNCRKAFSQPIPCDASGYVETQLDIPRYGCVAPSE